MQEDINAHLKTLTRGLMNDDPHCTYAGYNALFEIGPHALPSLTQAALDCDVSNVKYKELTRYITGLVTLIYDIDEHEGKNVVKEITSNGCADHLRVHLESLANFTLDDHDKYELRGIEVLEHKELDDEGVIRSYLESWMNNIPEDDLAGIHRIVVCRPNDIEAAGTYMPVLRKVSLKWEKGLADKTFKSRFFLLVKEHTFYHEIGHHVLRHTFGQQSDQEREANIYAGKIFKQVHPRIDKFIRFLKKLVSKYQ